MRTDSFEPIEHPDRIKSYFLSQKTAILAASISGALFNGCMFLGPVFQGKLIDSIVNQENLSQVLACAGIFILTILLIQIARFIKRYYVRSFANHTSKSMRLMIYNNILHQPMDVLKQQDTGDLLNKAIADVDICAEGMRKVTTEVFDTGVLMASYFISMLCYDFWLSLAAVIFVPVAMWLAEKLKKVIVRYSKEARTMSSQVSGMVYDNIDQTILMRVHGLEQLRKTEYDTVIHTFEKKQIKAELVTGTLQPLYQIIAMLGIIFVIYFGGRNVIDNQWTIGAFSAYLTIYTALTLKASKAANLFNAYQKAKVSWKRIKPNLKAYQYEDKTEVEDKKGILLHVCDLSFSYPETQKQILKQINFSLQPGQILGVTGPIASGKSSLGAVLTGMYPYQGSVMLNGMELSDYTKVQKSNRISYLSHNPSLLSDTIEHNITLGVEGDITQVLKDVCFDIDLKTMPDGIHTLVGDYGVRLSGGQQARIALARALYHNCSMMVLDDPFSAVDKATEAAIYENLRKRYKKRIILLISHRLFSFPNMDHILVLHPDPSYEYGRHEQLMQESALYQSLYQLQQGGDGHEA